MFLRLPLSETSFPVNPFLIAFALLVIATALWMDRTPTRLRGIGAVEWAMALYVMWNVYSMFAPHKYTAGAQLPNAAGIVVPFSVPRFIVIGTVIPFVMYAVGRYTFDRAAAVRALLWTILTLAAYSAAVSIMQFTGPTDWVWPRYIVDAPSWAGRAVGVFNQPVVNGMVLALGFAIAMLLLSRRSEPTWRRCVGIRGRRRLRLRSLSDPHPGSLAQRRGRAHHRCSSGQGIPQGVHHRPLPGDDGDDRHQLVGVHQR